jgi:hypothetical protein
MKITTHVHIFSKLDMKLKLDDMSTVVLGKFVLNIVISIRG